MTMPLLKHVRYLRTRIGNAKLMLAFSGTPRAQQEWRRKLAWYEDRLDEILSRPLPPEPPPKERGSNVSWAVFKRPQGGFVAVKAPTLSDRRRVLKVARNRNWSGGRYYRELPVGVEVTHV